MRGFDEVFRAVSDYIYWLVFNDGCGCGYFFNDDFWLFLCDVFFVII
jgi:hypothetical protein